MACMFCRWTISVKLPKTKHLHWYPDDLAWCIQVHFNQIILLDLKLLSKSMKYTIPSSLNHLHNLHNFCSAIQITVGFATILSTISLESGLKHFFVVQTMWLMILELNSTPLYKRKVCIIWNVAETVTCLLDTSSELRQQDMSVKQCFVEQFLFNFLTNKMALASPCIMWNFLSEKKDVHFTFDYGW